MSIEFYLIIGLMYTLINVIVRKLDSDGDWMLIMCWWFLWPIFFLTLLISVLLKALKKKRQEA